MFHMTAPRTSTPVPQLERIEGVYDLRTLKALSDLGVHSFAFDFRAKSPNFLQQHRFLEIMSKSYSPLQRYYLIYENEKDYIVRKMVEDLVKHVPLSNFTLDFRGKEDAAYCRSFSTPYALDYVPRQGLREALASPLCTEIGLSHNTVMVAHENRSMPTFARNFTQMVHESRGGRPLRSILRCDWDTDLFSSLFDFLDVDGLALPVNNKVEVCYRNVDLGKLKGQLRFFSGNA